MEKPGITLEDIQKQERELITFEEGYPRKLKEFEQRGQELHDRYSFLATMIDKERDKMTILLRRLSLSYEEAGVFFRETQQLLEQSRASYHTQTKRLLDEEERYRYQYRKEHERLEEELFRMRRACDESTDQ